MGNKFSTRPGNNNNSLPTRRETPQLEPVHKGFNPTRHDVHAAAHILMGLRAPGGGHLPAELALSILSHASYRPRVTSSSAGRRSYTPRADRPWYLLTPSLPADFGRAVSVTLQVRSSEIRRVGPADSHAYYFPPGDGDSDDDEGGGGRGRGAWFRLCILRAVVRRGTPPSPRMCCDEEDGWDPDFREGDAWTMVRRGGRGAWELYRHDSGSDDGEAPAVGAVVPPRPREAYDRIDWPADNNPDTQDPEAFLDGGAFLAALMPGDKIVLSAGAEDPVAMFAIHEAILEIEYDAVVESGPTQE